MEITSDPWSRLLIPVFVRTTSKLLLMPNECWSEEVDKGLITGCLWISCLLNGISRWWEFVNNHAMVHEIICIMTWYSLYNYFWCQIMNLRFFNNPHPDYPNTCIFIPNNSQSWCCLQRHKYHGQTIGACTPIWHYKCLCGVCSLEL
jgi:hypothetical protein